MSIKGSPLTYENNNHNLNKLKQRNSNIYSSKFTTSHLFTTSNSMGKIGSPLKSSGSKTDTSVIIKQRRANPHFQSPHMPAKYMNSKRKYAKYNNTYGQIYPDNSNYLHLNSLWSIWYGVLLTLFQGYLAVHGASRFLGCSLISWKIEPVAELNFQIILSGLVFVLLPFFFTSAVFKVGNMANDGVKLASASIDRLCSKTTHGSLEEESRTASLRTLWAHGGPTAAFMHILIAVCLLLPRLLLEGRIIENGLLPRETIWITELDFGNVNRHNLVALSIKTLQYQNNTLMESQEDEKYFNDTIFMQPSKDKNTKNYFHISTKQNKNAIPMTNGKGNYFELSDLVDAAVTNSNSKKGGLRYDAPINHTVSPIFTSIFTEDGGGVSTTNLNITTTYAQTSNYEDIGTTTITNISFTNSTQKYRRIAKTENKLVSFPSHHVSYNTNRNQHHKGQSNHNGKVIRKQYRQRKTHQQFLPHEKNGRLKDQNYSKFSFTDLDYVILSNKSQTNNGNNVYVDKPAPYESLDHFHTNVNIVPKLPTATSTTIRDSNIHIVRPEKFAEINASTPVSSNSKIIEIRQKINSKIKRSISAKKTNFAEIEQEYLAGELFLNDSNEYIAEINSIKPPTASTIQSTLSDYNLIHLDGFAGMLQLFFGVEKPIDLKAFSNPPSAEFLNLLFALLVWCVRYPAVFWTTAKSFATIFSVQMIASAADIIFSYIGISSLFKLQVYSQGLSIQNPGLILNASVTLALFLLSVVLILSSSMVLYLYGFGRLSAKMRDRSLISMSSNESWIYFAHCASLSYILALCVVKAPLLNDLSATYRISLHCPTLMAALVSIMHILLWIIIWMGLTFKRKWAFKLPPLDTYAIIGKAATQPLLIHNQGNLMNTTAASLNNSTNLDITSHSANENTEIKLKSGYSENMPNNTSNSDLFNNAPSEEIYWPKTTPSSPKLKVTFNEVTSTFDDNHHPRLIGEQEQNNDKRDSSHGASVCFTSIEGEVDDGEYATLRSDPTTIVGPTLGSSCETEISDVFCKNYSFSDFTKILHLSQRDDFPPPPPNMASSVTVTNHTTTVSVNPRNTYVNFISDCAGKVLDDNISEQGKLLEHMRDDSLTYASTNDLEPSLPPSPPSPETNETKHDNGPLLLQKNINLIAQCVQLSSSPEHLISPLSPARVAAHTNEAYVSQSSTPRFLRNVEPDIAHEALTPRSDTNSCGTECTTSPPERAPSESSSGVHSAEEREIEVIIRPRVSNKHASKMAPPAIQEEPNGRCTNMRMSSFAGGCNKSSATLPPQRSNAENKIDYSQHCSTMPLPANSHNNQQIQTTLYATSAHCMSKTQSISTNVSSFKTPLYANSGFALSRLQTRATTLSQQQVAHIKLSNGARYSNPNTHRRHSFLKAADSQYVPQTFIKVGHESSFVNSTIHENRDSANYSMISDQESLYTAANYLY